MQLIFVRRSDPFTWVVRKVERGEWSHVAVIHGAGSVVTHAKPFKGVHQSPRSGVIANASDYALVEVRGAQDQLVDEYLSSRLGCGYDYAALPGLLFGKNWSMSDRDYCSELAANAAVAGGLPVNRGRYRTGVQLLWEIATNEWDSTILLDSRYREAPPV